MKNLLKSSFLLLALISISLTMMSLSNENKSTIEQNTIVNEGDNQCTLYVKKSSGSPAKYASIGTSVSGGISCIGGRKYKTNDDGMVVLYWSSGCYLREIYINGSSHQVDFKPGGTYTISL